MMTMMTMATPRKAIVQTGPSLGNDRANLAIGILLMDQGLYMSRLPLGFALVFLRTLSRLLLVSMIADDDGTGGGGGGEVGNTIGSACLMTTAMTTNTTTKTNTTTRRMGRGHKEEWTTGRNLTTMFATSSTGRLLGA
jgi:hypothetical protein